MASLQERRPSPPPARPPPASRPVQRFAVQDRVFAALERLEQKETQHTAFQELERLLRDLEPANLATLLHAAGTTNAKTTTFARVHCLRLAALCTQQSRCPMWRAMLTPPLLPKLLGLLARGLHDSDSAVRLAVAEGFGTVAAQLLATNADGCELTAGNPSNPLLACILDALGEPGGAVQAAAAAALAAAADHLRPGLDAALLRHLLRALSNPLFLGRAELCGAIARLEDGRLRGLLASSCQQLLAAMPELLGSTDDSTGLLGALTTKGKDFQARAAAAHTLKALVVGIGPLCPVGWDAVVAALRAAKTDVSKPVRDAALAALPVTAGLLDFLAAGAPAAAWQEACGSILAATEGGKGRRASPGVGSKTKVLGAGRTAGLEELGSGQRIAAAWPPGASAAAPTAVLVAAPPMAAGSGFTPVLLPPSLPHAMLLLTSQPGAAPNAAPPAYPAAFSPAAIGGTAAALPGGAGGAGAEQLAAQLTAIQAQQAHMAATLTAFTASTQGTLSQLQHHLASVSAGVASLAAFSVGNAGAAGSPQQQQRQQQALLQQHLASVQAGVAALAVGVGGVQQAQQAQQAQQGQQHMAPAVGGFEQALAPAAAAAGGGAVQWSRKAHPPPALLPQSQPKRLSSLHRSYDALEQQRARQAPAGAGTAALVLQHPNSPASSGPALPGAAAMLPSQHGSPAAPTPGSPSTPASCDSAFAQLLSGPAGGLAGDQQAQLRLLRLMAKSGTPVWGQLTPSTGQQLMEAIAELLQEGIALKRLLPWLWPLADTASPAAAAAASFPVALRQMLLHALAAYPLPASSATAQQQREDGSAAADGGSEALATAATVGSLGEKRQLLLSALRAVWDSL